MKKKTNMNTFELYRQNHVVKDKYHTKQIILNKEKYECWTKQAMRMLL